MRVGRRPTIPLASGDSVAMNATMEIGYPQHACENAMKEVARLTPPRQLALLLLLPLLGCKLLSFNSRLNSADLIT